MKIRIDGQNIGFRISKDDLKQLINEQILTQTLYLPNGCQVEFSIHIQAMDTALKLNVNNQNMQLYVSKIALDQLNTQSDKYYTISNQQKLNDENIVTLKLDLQAHRIRKR